MKFYEKMTPETKKPEPVFVSYHKRSKKFKECLIIIKDWRASDGAKLYVKYRENGKSYSLEELSKLEENISVSIPPYYYTKEGKLVRCVKDRNIKGEIKGKGEIFYNYLKKIILKQEMLRNADVIEIVENKFTRKLKQIMEGAGTLYCCLCVNTYDLKKEQQPAKSQSAKQLTQQIVDTAEPTKTAQPIEQQKEEIKE